MDAAFRAANLDADTSSSTCFANVSWSSIYYYCYSASAGSAAGEHAGPVPAALRLRFRVWAFAEAESVTAANQASKSIPARAVGIHAASVPREGSTLHDHSCISNIICSLLLNLVSNYASSDSSSSYSGNVSKKKLFRKVNRSIQPATACSSFRAARELKASYCTAYRGSMSVNVSCDMQLHAGVGKENHHQVQTSIDKQVFFCTGPLQVQLRRTPSEGLEVIQLSFHNIND